MKYKLTFIEDEPRAIRMFRLRVEDKFDYIDIPPYRNIDRLMSEIINARLHAIVIDYCLTDAKIRIKYDGEDVVERLKRLLPGFPVFLLTSYLDKAENDAMDVNMVYDKDDYFRNPETLNRRIKKQIDNYIEQIKEKEARVLKLLKKQKESKKFTVAEEEELIELDGYLERSLLGKSIVPRALKKISNTEKLNKLIQNTEDLIRQMKK